MSDVLSTRLQYSKMVIFFPRLMQHVTTYDKDLVFQVRAKFNCALLQAVQWNWWLSLKTTVTVAVIMLKRLIIIMACPYQFCKLNFSPLITYGSVQQTFTAKGQIYCMLNN